ncbi:hypothetical protein [Hymenobacter sp. HDW8]|uniref:hypothetical protein n=1 Tax=Hymenobacter sp. HDW8 TaxID=2714932 RepID=UPI0014082057|nr:hypothetical protein [Hymenobacter sp. HDW8]QIL78355.1 hypothetical protein G7064_21305 [Hymenobacter sp. HDW8]
MNTLFHSIALVLLSVGASQAQSLVANGGFEQLTICPKAVGDIDCAKGWKNGGLTPDLFSTCTNGTENGLNVPDNYVGFQHPAVGRCYAGIALFTEPKHLSMSKSLEVTESIWTPLATPLRPGKTYRFSVLLALADSSVFTSQHLTPLLRKGPFNRMGKRETSQALLLDIAAVDTAWREVSVTFTATDRWAYLSLGLSREVLTLKAYKDRLTRRRNAVTYKGQAAAYYYVDEVELLEMK